MTWRCLGLVLAVSLWLSVPSSARASVAGDFQEQDNLRKTVSLAVGPALLLKSKSNALPHLLAPMASLSVAVPFRARFTLGGQALALVDANKHYRVLGVLASGTYAFWQRERFGMAVQLGVGLGTNADILNSDLRGAGVAIYASAGVDARWSVGDAWIVGAQLDTLNLASARIAPFVARRF